MRRWQSTQTGPRELKARYTFTEKNAEEILRREVGVVFATVFGTRKAFTSVHRRAGKPS